MKRDVCAINTDLSIIRSGDLCLSYSVQAIFSASPLYRKLDIKRNFYSMHALQVNTKCCRQCCSQGGYTPDHSTVTPVAPWVDNIGKGTTKFYQARPTVCTLKKKRLVHFIIGSAKMKSWMMVSGSNTCTAQSADAHGAAPKVPCLESHADTCTKRAAHRNEFATRIRIKTRGATVVYHVRKPETQTQPSFACVKTAHFASSRQ